MRPPAGVASRPERLAKARHLVHELRTHSDEPRPRLDPDPVALRWLAPVDDGPRQRGIDSSQPSQPLRIHAVALRVVLGRPSKHAWPCQPPVRVPPEKLREIAETDLASYTEN